MELSTLIEGILGLTQGKPVEIFVVTIENTKATFQRFDQVKLVHHKTIYETMEGLQSLDVVVKITRDTTYIHIASAGTGFHTDESHVEVDYDLGKNLVTLLSRPDKDHTIVTAIQIH